MRLPTPKSHALGRGHHSKPSLLPLVRGANNLRIENGGPHTSLLASSTATHETEPVVPFYLSRSDVGSNKSIGFLRPEVFSALDASCRSSIGESPWQITRRADSRPAAVSFADSVAKTGKYGRTMHMQRLVEEWKHQGKFPDILRGWSNEGFPVYHPSSDSVALNIERAALPLFGFPNFGVFLVAYFKCCSSHRTMIWCPRRSWTKRTWPGKLDVTVGGGIASGDTALSTILRESVEEASLEAEYVQNHIVPRGSLHFSNRSPSGWILPGIYHTFDLPLPPDNSIIPKPNDDEVEEFVLMDAQTVHGNLLEEKFKSSSALAMVDFLIRHKLVTADNEPNFGEVREELRRKVPLPVL